MRREATSALLCGRQRLGSSGRASMHSSFLNKPKRFFHASSAALLAQPPPQQSKQEGEEAEELVTVERDQGDAHVAIVHLNRPHKLNALTVELGETFQAKMAALRAEGEASRLRCVVLTGRGKAFSAGGDLDFLWKRTESEAVENTATMLQFYKRFLSVRDLPVPVVSAINGAAVGAGLCLAMATDIRIASEDAILSCNFAKLGLHPGLAATHFMPLIVGPQVAASLLYTGKNITGAEAKRYGLVLDAVPRAQVMEEALKLAREIAASSPSAVRLLVRTLRTKQNEGLERALTREADGQAHSYASADLKEGLQAIAEKRKPIFL
ncbi:EnoylCoA hydratase/isomerase family domain containing protein [Balamuthia mandrillaris]